MKINNPKQFSGVIDYDESFQDDLVTLEQLKIKTNELEQKIIKYLTGSDEVNQLTKSYGYAYLNENRKIDESLLPEYAITNTFIVNQFTLMAYTDPLTNEIGNPIIDVNEVNADIYDPSWRINNWINSNDFKKIYGSLIPEQGDIINVIYEKSKETDYININVVGSYIVTNTSLKKIASNSIVKCVISKLVQNGSNITSVNDIEPSNSRGSIDIDLSDILIKDKKINFKTDFEKSDVDDLTDNLYRITSKEDGVNFRLGFKIDVNNTKYYAFDDELQSESNLREKTDNIISSAFDNFVNESNLINQKINDNFDVLNNKMLKTDSELSASIELTNDKLNSTKSDLENVYNTLNNTILSAKSELSTNISNVQSELSTNISNVQSELSTNISNVQSELSTNISNVQSELSTNISNVNNDLTKNISNVYEELVKLNNLLSNVLVNIYQHTFTWNISNEFIYDKISNDENLYIFDKEQQKYVNISLYKYKASYTYKLTDNTLYDVNSMPYVLCVIDNETQQQITVNTRWNNDNSITIMIECNGSNNRPDIIGKSMTLTIAAKRKIDFKIN